VIIGRTWLDADQARAGDALGLLVETRKGSGLAQKELAGRMRRGDGRPVAPRYLNRFTPLQLVKFCHTSTQSERRRMLLLRLPT
jgi:hypothetical protein